MGILARHKYLLLLVVQVAMLIWSSFAHRLPISPVVSEALVTGVMIAVFLVVFTRRRERAVALALVIMAAAVKWSRYVVPPQEGSILQPVVFHALSVVFLAFAVFVILRHIFAEKSITGDEVVGTVCGYFIAGLLWSHVYAVVELTAPGSFVFNPELAKQAMSWDGSVAIFNYFSLVTLTTMGYGDVTPLHGPATALATIEAVFGQFYIAIVVAQMVGIQLAQATTPRNGGGS
jgi:voltage-gated potassium channel